MKIPWYIPSIGMLISFALIITSAFVPNSTILISGLILLHVFGWILAARFVISGVGLFSWALNPK